MLKLKYIISENKNIIVFPETLNHSDFSHLKPTSAGFIYFATNHEGEQICKCHGESTTLGLKSEPGDSELAIKQLIKNQF